MNNKLLLESSSFRDPSGFVFYQDGQVYRQINHSYREHFEFLRQSFLYDRLIKHQLMWPFTQVDKSYGVNDDAYAVVAAEKIPFISYPYEWSFSQLQDAAITILSIQKMALEQGMSLKDASAFNIQFVAGKPLLIDLLSLEKYQEGTPWIAYRQFCQHFLAPLALMSYRDVRLGQLLKIHLDGLPLDLASGLLPQRTWLNFSLATHLHLQAKTQRHFAKGETHAKKARLSRRQLISIIDNLLDTVVGLRLQLKASQWSDYYDSFSYSDTAFEHKKSRVARFLKLLAPTSVWDLGANTGEFSRLAAAQGCQTIAFDADFLVVDKNYLTIKKNHEARILPLVVDLTNPTPALGWENQERQSLIARGPADCALALALIHHLAIANNLPLVKIAAFLSRIAHSLIIEFIPKKDAQVKRLLTTREDIFFDYHQKSFEKAFGWFFRILAMEKIRDSERIMYCMRKK